MMKPRAWTKEDDDTLRAMYATHTRQQIGVVLGRREAQVRSRCWTLGLNTKHPAHWSDEDVELLKAYYSSEVVKLDELASRLGRNKGNICRKARQLGLTDQKRKKVETRKDRNKFKTVAERRAHLSQCMKNHIAKNGHPRGALGMKHSEEMKMNQSKRSRDWHANASEETKRQIQQKVTLTCLERYGKGRGYAHVENAYSRCKRGKREDLGGQFFRSSWEANYARYLDFLISKGQIKGWEYEPDTFIFHGITRGAISYMPDFKVTENDGSVVYHEVKGWMTSEARTRLKRMAKFYPDVKILLVGEREYKEIECKVGRMIPNWERRGSKPEVAVIVETLE
jgi:hypothetical protein